MKISNSSGLSELNLKLLKEVQHGKNWLMRTDVLAVSCND